MRVFTVFVVVATIYYPSQTLQLKCETCVAKSSPFEESLLDIFRKLSSSQVCLWSNDDETADHLLKTLSRYKAMITFNTTKLSNLPSTCLDNIIVYDSPVQETCSNIFSGEGLTVHHTLVMLVVADCPFCVEEWSRCSAKFGYARVSLVFLGESRAFSLSSPLFPPRAFVQADLPAVLKPLDIEPRNLNGREVSVATFNCSPFVIIRENDNFNRIDGIEGGVLRDLRKKLNFSLRIARLAGKGRWGSVVDGVWEGGIGRTLADGAADLGVCNIWHTTEYHRVAEFGPPINVVTFTYIVPRPRPLDQWHGLAAGLSGGAWICTVASCIAAVLCYALHSYCRDPSTPIADHLSEGAVAVWGTVTQCSWPSRRAWPGAGGRALLAGWAAFVLLLAAAFGGGIIAQMTRPHYEPRLDTVRQLVEGGYRWLNNEEAARWQTAYFKFSDKWQDLWAARYVPEVPPKLVAGAIRSRRFALPVQRWGRGIVFLTFGGLDAERDLADMRVLREDTAETKVGFVVARRSPLRAAIQSALHQFLEVGVFHHWARHAVLMHGEKYSKVLLEERDDVYAQTSAKHLTLDNLSPAFIILACGLTTSLLVFVAEVLWHRYYNRTPFPFIL